MQRSIHGSRLLTRSTPMPMRTLDTSERHAGHTHFWERALSRRKFIQAAGAAVGMLGASHWSTATAAVPGDFPTAIPGGFTFPPLPGVFHNFAPGVFDPLNTDRSGIFNFNGQIGYAVIDGTGTGRTTSGVTRLAYEADLRFMQGVYVATNGRRLNRTFCLI